MTETCGTSFFGGKNVVTHTLSVQRRGAGLTSRLLATGRTNAILGTAIETTCGRDLTVRFSEESPVNPLMPSFRRSGETLLVLRSSGPTNLSTQWGSYYPHCLPLTKSFQRK